MPKRLIRFNILNRQSKKGMFLKDPKADFIVILQKKIFPLHKQLLSPSLYFQQLITNGEKSIVISNQINANHFQQMLGCFYGIQAAFERHLLIDNILPILALLRVNQFDDQLKLDMRNNSDQYGLFGLFQLSKKLQLKDVEQKCMKQLIDEDFQQVNYNKYDLFQLGPQLFTFVFKQHEKLAARAQIKGLDKKLIQAVCQEYCKTNSAKLDIEEILNYGNQFKNQQESFQVEAPKVRRRNGTWNNGKQNGGKKDEFSILSETKFHSFEQKSDQLMKIRIINSNIQQNNNRLAAQIKTVKSQMNDKEQKRSIESGVDQIDKKLKQFEQKSKNAHKKMQQLKKKMLKLNNQQQNDKSDEQQGKNLSTQSGNVKRNKNGVLQSSSKILSEMAVLQKSKDVDSDASDF